MTGGPVDQGVGEEGMGIDNIDGGTARPCAERVTALKTARRP